MRVIRIGIGWNKTCGALSRFFNGWFKIIEYCGAPQILEMVVFMDISAVSDFWSNKDDIVI